MFSKELISIIEKAKGKRIDGVSSFQTVARRYKLTQEGAQEELNKISGSISAALEADVKRGISIIDARIEKVKKDEHDDAVRRATDSGYQDRLYTKARTINSISEANMPEAENIRDFFAEFESDPVAISYLRTTFAGNMIVSGLLPQNYNGIKIERMEKLKEDFKAAITAASSLTFGNLAAPVIIENVKAYIAGQDEECGLDPVRVWSEIHEKNAASRNGKNATSGNGNGAPAPAGSFANAFNFSQVRV